tara:strand:- start:3807 stop:3992 length:186 start_codon:yes stop_codon:yes gene_type:complete
MDKEARKEYNKKYYLKRKKERKDKERKDKEHERENKSKKKLEKGISNSLQFIKGNFTVYFD